MQFGRYYEEFEVGAVYKHWPGKTVTEYDDHLFCLLTMNHHPLHLDAHYAQETTDFKRNVVVGNYVYSLLLGMSVADVSGKAIANLEVESLRHIRPTFHGDTLYGETEVLDKTPSRSKDDRGVVHVETRGYNQDGTVVCVFRRKVMVPTRALRRRPRRRAAGPAGAEGVTRRGAARTRRVNPSGCAGRIAQERGRASHSASASSSPSTSGSAAMAARSTNRASSASSPARSGP